MSGIVTNECTETAKRSSAIIRRKPSAHLFDGAKSWTNPGRIFATVGKPRCVSEIPLHRKQSKQSELAIRHVVIMSTQYKPSHGWHFRVTEHDHCMTQTSLHVK